MAWPAWLTAWWRPRPAAAPSLWGKLPTHADFLRHRTSAEAARQWQHWLHRHGPAQRHRVPASPWMQLSPGPADLSGVPVAFVLPPGALAFSGSHHVAGVLADSRDSQGRRHPLLLWRCLPLRTVLAQAAMPGWPWWHAQAQLLEHWTAWLDWREDEARPARPGAARPAGRPDWLGLCEAADALDARTPATPRALHAVLPRLLPTLQADGLPPLNSALLDGVTHMPWPGWPQGEAGVARQAAFWRQDAEGRIVCAASTLAGMFRTVREAA